MTLNTYARLELLGHVSLHGYLTTEEVAGVQMIRIDIARGGEKGVETRYYGAGAVYCITPMTEDAVLEATRPVVRRLSPYIDAAEFDPENEESPGW